MVSVGLIHLSCYCGADLFYIGNTIDGAPPFDVIEKLESRFGDGDYGFFSSANGEYGECPHCGLLFELPDPKVLNWLPFTDKETFTSTVEELRRSAFSLNNAAAQHAYIAGNRSPL